MNKQSAIQILQSRKLVAAAGMYALQVTSVNTVQSPQGPRALVNLKAMTDYQFNEAKRLIKEGNTSGNEDFYAQAANQNLVSGQRIGKDYVPAKGEFVNVMVELTTTNNGVTGLFVTSISPIKAEAAVSLSKSSFDDLDEEEVIVTDNTPATGDDQTIDPAAQTEDPATVAGTEVEEPSVI